MAVLIINPNSTVTMTDAMVQTARLAAPGMTFEGWTSHDGPPAIQGQADGEAATPPLLELVRQAGARNADGIVIGCFDDTALADAAAMADCPVIGIGQASYHFAALRQWRFSVVTTLPVSVPVIEENIAALGLADHVSRVRASQVPVLALERDQSNAEQIIAAEALRAEQQDGIDAVILGCAGMVRVVETLERSVAIPVLDPIKIAATCMAWLAGGRPPQ